MSFSTIYWHDAKVSLPSDAGLVLVVMKDLLDSNPNYNRRVATSYYVHEEGWHIEKCHNIEVIKWADFPEPPKE